MLTVVGVLLLLACTKEISTLTPELLTKWDKIEGSYKVYDTLGEFLYDLNIVHVPDPENETIDSLRFENFDGEFTFTVKQENFANMPMYVRIGVHNILFDTQNRRWKLGGAAYEHYNQFEKDTIRLRFQKTNINYYIEDSTPYFECDCKQIAVKQH